MKPLIYTGGLAETNGYLVPIEPGRFLAIDAPEGFLDFCRSHMKSGSVKMEALILTHGHWDHLWDAASIAREFSCPVFYHKDDEPLCAHPSRMRGFGLPIDIEPVEATRYIDEGETLSYGDYSFQLFHIPGHCPGSICLYEKNAKALFAGDVLFKEAVGRWDLPGGSREILIEGIQTKLFTLPDDTIVYSGHGEPTTIGHEKRFNPYARL